jgi:UDP-glucose 4-epimerase
MLNSQASHSRKVLVTGGAGYIGSHTVVELGAAGYQPVILDDFSNSSSDVPDRIAAIMGERCPVYRADCTDAAALEAVFAAEGPFLAVIHFAAFKAVGESVAQPTRYYRNNIGSLTNLLDVMARHGNPGLVFSSSCTVYGQPKELPVTEDSPIMPASSPYGYTKQVCEQLIQDQLQSPSGISAVILRYFNPIGAHPSGLIGELPQGVPNNLVPYVTQSAAGLRPPVTVYGTDYATPDGSCIRDYLHVVDLARAHVAALQCIVQPDAPQFVKIFNVGSGQGHSVLEVLHAMERVLGRQLHYVLGPRRPGDVEAIWASTGARALPGWAASLDLETALRDAWRWQERQLSKSR